MPWRILCLKIHQSASSTACIGQILLFFFLCLWRFARPGLSHHLTWFALVFCAVIILSEQDRRTALLILAVGSVLGYFLERWGTTRLYWSYYTCGMPPWVAVLSHGMVSLAI